jgi:hypothetical protein
MMEQEKIVPESWHSYPSIFALGHRLVSDILKVPVRVEEKIDGSQFSWCVSEGGEVLVRSKGAVMYLEAPEKMFSKAVDTVKSIKEKCHPGWTYRAEYLAKPKHNTLAYERVPTGNLIIFDINTGHECYLGETERRVESERIGLESIPVLYEGMLEGPSQIRQFLDTQSCLGGQKVEGVVIKPLDYAVFGPDKKVLMAKFVSEAFKEIHTQSWKDRNPKSGDIIDRLAETYTTPARWNKAIQHLTERGELEGSPRDIGKLIIEIPNDVQKECEEEIKTALFAWAWPQLRRSITKGMPEYYKEQLMKSSFDKETA